jgi:hypothetical protein
LLQFGLQVADKNTIFVENMHASGEFRARIFTADAGDLFKKNI